MPTGRTRIATRTGKLRVRARRAINRGFPVSAPDKLDKFRRSCSGKGNVYRKREDFGLGAGRARKPSGQESRLCLRELLGDTSGPSRLSPGRCGSGDERTMRVATQLPRSVRETVISLFPGC